MSRVSRRQLLKTAAAGSMAWGLPRLASAAAPSEQVRVAILGMGGLNVVGGVGGRGRQLAARLAEVPAARVATLCDVDREILDHEVGQFAKQGKKVEAVTDFRKVLDDRSIDAVFVATPNHWHALMAIWACQAGKDAYVEKPISYDLWEGRQIVAAAKRYQRIVQVGTQRRSSTVLPEAFAFLRQGAVGKFRVAHALIYRGRDNIGKVDAPTPIPDTVDYDLWCGPVAKGPLRRKQLHYDWHWVWDTGNGEIGNNGAHMIDIARWALGHDGPPPRAMSIGGRFAFNDDGETVNTQLAWFDYQPAPLICEIRNVRATKGAPMGKFQGAAGGIVVRCEGGYFAGDMTAGTVFDTNGMKVKQFTDNRKTQQVETAHVANFIDAVRSRKAESLHADAAVGHASAACSHLANLSHRLGRPTPLDRLAAAVTDRPVLADALVRMADHLKGNGVDLQSTPAVLGPWIGYDAQRGCCTGPQAAEAERLSRREYRAPFVVPAVS